MSAPLDPSDEHRIRRAAAEWLVKHDRQLTAAEQDEFLQWLAADPRHGRWFSRHRSGWHRLDGLAAWAPADTSKPNPDVLAAPPARRSASARRPVWLAAAAAVVVLAVAAASWSAWRSPARTPAPAVAVAPTGYEKRELPDGSIVELNHGAAIEVDFSPGERRIRLHGGEALFTVAKNPARPFIVFAQGVAVRAVGTAFNVRCEPASIEILVTEGKVQVAPPATRTADAGSQAGPLVVAGQRAVVAHDSGQPPRVMTATTQDLERLRAWQPQLLDFPSTPLADVIAELNRRNRVQLTLADPSSAGVRIVAAIRSDNIDGFVAIVTAATGLTAERTGDYDIVLRRTVR
jgi:transmembrane sensor